MLRQRYSALIIAEIIDQNGDKSSVPIQVRRSPNSAQMLPKDFPYLTHRPHPVTTSLKDLCAWCLVNCRGEWYYYNTCFKFELGEDLALFKVFHN